MTALAFAGRIDFNPLTDFLINDKGEKVKLDPPSGEELPVLGFANGNPEFRPEWGAPVSSVNVSINPKSDRLQVLEKFGAWEGKDLENLLLLIKVKGKCTTDHISPAGPWLKYKGLI